VSRRHREHHQDPQVVRLVLVPTPAPRSPLYRGIWRAHRLHHFRNERYWFGVTTHLGDRVLCTYPAKDAVPLSTTARTLGVDVAA
jgi:hypothetical protein